MSYEQIKTLPSAQFKRLCGVKPETFGRMCEYIRAELRRTQKKSGRPPIPGIENQVLVMLEYWREYRTQFHIAGSRGVSEATVWRIIGKVEECLKNCPDFRLPGKKQLSKSENTIEVIIVDATETPIERPKKTTPILFGQEEAAYDKVASCGQ